jgi:hypothetical protein
MSVTRRFVWRVGWCLLAAGAVSMGLAACGGSDGGGTPTTPTPAPTPTPCAQEVLFQDNGPIPASTLMFDDFSVPRPGRLDITVNWTFDDSRVGFYLVPANTCTLDEFNNRSCDFEIRAEPSGQKPRLISDSVTQGNYRWLLANFNDERQESVSLEIVLSEGSCPAHAGGRPDASAWDEETVPVVRGVLPR